MIHFFQPILHWLAPPVFDGEEEKTRQAFLINLILQAGVLLLIAVLSILPWVSTEKSYNLFLFAIITIFMCLVASKFLLQRGKVQETGFFLTAVLWLVFVYTTLVGKEGLAGTPFIGAVTVTPLIAGFVSGTNASVIITVLNWGLGSVLVWQETTGLIPIAVQYEPLPRFMASMVMFSVFPLLVYLWRRNFDEAIMQVKAVEAAQRETAAYRLQNEVLEEAVLARTSALEKSLSREQNLAEKLALALQVETELGQLQSRIITVVSHEFRTPLSIINSSAELLQQYYEKLPQVRREAAHARIQESVFYLNDLLKDVTLVDQAQRAKIRPSYKTFPFSDLCRQLIEKMLFEVNQPKRLNFQYPSEAGKVVETDLNLLQQILANLVSNALKYSSDDVPVQVNFWLEARKIVLEVQDQGIGIPLQEQAKVFDLFYRASNVDERRGLGLGLFIVKSLSKLLQGEVFVESRGQGQGARFQVKLPLSPTVEQERPALSEEND